MKRTLAWIILVFSILLFLGGGLGFAAYSWLGQWGEISELAVDATEIQVASGTTLKNLSEDLQERGLVQEAKLFELWVVFYSDYRRFQAGRYRFEGKVSPGDIAQEIIDGNIYVPKAFQVTIPEGFSLRQLGKRLHKAKIGTEQELAWLSTHAPFLKELKIASPSLEGYVYPATYSFEKIPSIRQVLEKGVKTFWEKLPADYQQQLKQRKLSLHQAVTLASLIEAETPHDFERSRVSEVIQNRLKKGIALGIDAAIIYGIEDYKGDIKFRHLKDASNPYNTRIHKGLPPSPICSPALASLKAVLEPTAEGWYYYVLDPETNEHQFSKSFKEHQQHVRKLVKYSRQKK